MNVGNFLSVPYTLFLFVAIRSSALFTLVRRYLVSFAFFTTRHMLLN
jgi:hypothetical protein